MRNFHSKSSYAETIGPALVEHEFVQQKIDYQMCLLESFNEFLQTKEDEYNKMHAKHVLAMEAWRSESIRQNTMKRHKATFCMQAQGMMNRHQRPTLMPLPLPLLYVWRIPIILTLHVFYQSCLALFVKGYLNLLGIVRLFFASMFITHGVQ